MTHCFCVLTDSLSPKAPSFLGLMGRFLGNSHRQLPRTEPGQLSIEGGHLSPVLSTPGQVKAERLAIHVPVHTILFPGPASWRARCPCLQECLIRLGWNQARWGEAPFPIVSVLGTGQRQARASHPPVASCPSGQQSFPEGRARLSVHTLDHQIQTFSVSWHCSPRRF